MAEESAALEEMHEYRRRRDAEEGEDGDEWKDDGELLVEAANGGQLEVVQYLVEEAEVSVEVMDRHKYRPLHHAANQGHLLISRFLLDCGADISARSRFLETPLLGAVVGGHLALVELLLEQGASADVEDGQRNRPLHVAAGFLHLSVVECLLQQRAGSIGINAQNEDGETALHVAAYAAYCGDDEAEEEEPVLKVVRLLVEEGEADPLIRNKEGKRASDWAKEVDFFRVERYLLEAEEMAEMQKQA